MIFKKIILKNFGPFYSDQIIYVSTKDDKNVTFIHAQNYVGKTSILRAIIWCLYGEVIPGDDGSKVEILNDQAKEENDFETLVSIEFIHDKKNYKFERKAVQKKLSSSRVETENTFIGFEIDQYGHHTSDSFLSEPQNVINFFAPVELSKFFFLKGENSPLNSTGIDLRDSIKEILGFNVLDQANKDLTYIANSIRKDASKSIDNQEIRNLKELITGFEISEEKNRKKIESAEEQIAEADIQIIRLEEEISDWQRTQGEKRLLKKLTEEISKAEDRKKRLLDKKARWFRGKLFSLLSKELCES